MQLQADAIQIFCFFPFLASLPLGASQNGLLMQLQADVIQVFVLLFLSSACR